MTPDVTPRERSEQIRIELGFSPEKWAAMNRQERRAAARRYRNTQRP